MLADIVFLSVVLLLVLAAVQVYTRLGSGIDQHPYHHVHGGAPGAAGASRMSRSADREILSWTRGTR
jgi:hypothetical protein